MKETMQAVVKREEFGAGLEKVAVPQCGEFEVLVEVLATAICGSDIHRYHWEPSRGAPNFKIPIVMGHEFCGRVIETGSKVTHVKEGEIITAETHIPCGHCYQCETGNQHICANLKIFGMQVDGCFSEYFTLPAVCAWPVPDDLTPEQATLMEPLGVAYHALSFSNVNGDTVAIVGCGPVGLFAVQVARSMGASIIIAIDKSQARLRRARELGADEVLNVSDGSPSDAALRITKGIGVGTVIEASGSATGFNDGLSMARKGGTFVAVGIPQKPVEVNVSKDLIRKALTIRGIHGRRMYDTWHAITALIEQKRFDLKSMITGQVPLSEFEQGFEMAESGEHIKVLLIPGQ